MTRPVILGFGRADRQDDGVGPYVIAALRDAGVDADTRLIRPDPNDLIAALDGRDRAVLIDACLSGAPAGQVQEFDLARDRMPTLPRSAHGMSLPAAIELVRHFQGLPAMCTLIAVEAGGFGHYQPMTPAVTAAADRIAARLVGMFGAAEGRVLPVCGAQRLTRP